MCLKELRDEFLYDCECRHLAKGSLRNYRASTRFLLEFLERKQITELEDVRPRHLRDLMKEKQDAGNTPRYINDLLKVWRTWFNYLVEEGYLEERDTFAQMQLKVLVGCRHYPYVGVFLPVAAYLGWDVTLLRLLLLVILICGVGT